MDLYKRLGDFHNTVRHIHLIKEQGKKIYLTESHDYYVQLHAGYGNNLRLCDYVDHSEHELCRCQWTNGAVSFLISVHPECIEGEAKLDIFEVEHRKGIKKSGNKYVIDKYITKYTPLNPVFKLKEHFVQQVINTVQNVAGEGKSEEKKIEIEIRPQKLYRNPIK